MNGKGLTAELKSLLKYIKDDMSVRFPKKDLIIEYFMLAVYERTDNMAHEMLEKVMMSEAMESLMSFYQKYLAENSESHEIDGNKLYDGLYDQCLEYAEAEYGLPVSSGKMLLAVVRNVDIIEKTFRTVGVDYQQLRDALDTVSGVEDITPTPVPQVTIKPTKRTGRKNHIKEQQIHGSKELIGEAERNCVVLTDIAEAGHIDEVYGNDGIIDRIFSILSMKEDNNVLITGAPGVGKTATVEHIANRLVKGDVPNAYKGRKLLSMDLLNLEKKFQSVNFDTRIKAILDDVSKRDNYILFCDNFDRVLDRNTVGGLDVNILLTLLTKDRGIKFICAMNDSCCSEDYYKNKNNFVQSIHRITVEEKTEEETVKIVKERIGSYADYHGVKYSDEAVEVAVHQGKKHVPNAVLPKTAFDVLDETGAKLANDNSEDAEIERLEKRLAEIAEERDNLDSYERYDELTKEQIFIKSEIERKLKVGKMADKRIPVTGDMVLETISKRSAVPVTKITEDDKAGLATLGNRIKEAVIGQDEAVNEVCRAVRRKRMGFADANKPVVLFFAGSTGTGKTYLAKRLAFELFGNEKNMTRLDMSEYNDRMSVNKLYGSSAGYIGYERGGILTEAVKKKPNCVLLLDEIEKACDDVHDVFLQIFDDGRLTDNKGTTVDFSNTIIIMTSNVGAKEAAERGGGIGFVKTGIESKDIFMKSMKRKFKPEFINRIDKTVFFNRLSDDNLRNIIRLELEKVCARVRDMGYDIDKGLINGKLTDTVMEDVKGKGEFGARPVIHSIQHIVEDTLTDYVIDNDLEKGTVFGESVFINVL